MTIFALMVLVAGLVLIHFGLKDLEALIGGLSIQSDTGNLVPPDATVGGGPR